MADGIAPQPAFKDYSFWQTVGLFLLVFLFQNLIGGLTAVLFAVYTGHAAPAAMSAYVPTLATNGLFIGLSTLLTVPPCIVLIMVLARRRSGFTTREYLGLTPVSGRGMALWLSLTVAFALLNALANRLAHHPEVSSFGLDAYRTAGFVPLLWLAFVVLAPVFEELFFRGLLFKSFARSGVGEWGAVVITAALFAVLHLQYDAFDIATIFVLGLLLGTARLKSGSTYQTMAMHALINLASTFEVLLRLHGQG